jgi:hypothetical protein
MKLNLKLYLMKEQILWTFGTAVAFVGAGSYMVYLVHMLWQHFSLAGRMCIGSRRAVSLLRPIERLIHKPFIQFPIKVSGLSFLREIQIPTRMLRLSSIHPNHLGHPVVQERSEYEQKIVAA